MSDKEQEQPKRTRIPLTYDSIEKGALRLTLADKVKLRNKLIEAIATEVQNAKAVAEEVNRLLMVLLNNFPLTYYDV